MQMHKNKMHLLRELINEIKKLSRHDTQDKQQEL